MLLLVRCFHDLWFSVGLGAFLVDQSQGRKGQWKEALTAANLAREDGVVFDVYTYSVLMRSVMLLSFFFLRAREMHTGSLTCLQQYMYGLQGRSTGLYLSCPCEGLVEGCVFCTAPPAFMLRATYTRLVVSYQ